MPKKGTTNNPNGRKKGVPNKATTKAREAIALFVDDNSDKLQEWLDKIAEDRTLEDGATVAGKPEEAFKLFMSVVEYHIPKLARTDLQHLDENGDPSKAGFEITVKHVKPVDSD